MSLFGQSVTSNQTPVSVEYDKKNSVIYISSGDIALDTNNRKISVSAQPAGGGAGKYLWIAAGDSPQS